MRQRLSFVQACCAYFFVILSVLTYVGRGYAQGWEGEELLESSFCHGKAMLSDPEPANEGGDLFEFRAKSYYERLASGQKILTYNLVLYVKPGTVGLYSGGKYLVEWKPIVNEKLLSTKLIFANPLMEEIEPIASAAMDRFLVIGFRGMFNASIFPKANVERSAPKDSWVKVYNRHLDLVGSFPCQALIEAP